MKGKIPKVGLTFIIAILFFGFINYAPTIAIVQLVKNKAYHKPPKADQWKPTQKGLGLESGTLVKTDEKSFLLIKFLDGSFLRVGEKTVLEVLGENPKGNYSRKINVENGGVDFKVTKVKGKFEFTTPLSVATIRGTEGVLISRTDADTLMVREGEVDFFNKISNISRTVKAGEIGISTKVGEITTRQMTESEQQKSQEIRRAIEKREIEIRGKTGEGKEIRIKIKEK
ncbi:FecR family protein [Candidatus Thermokryptus mobilis]|uniref:FecR family protein n=1 Tax=Candidatus Thermokryptus mobilis TaxID=1643428 RepID=A0A0S4N915_9BACT|nr:FecR family protein [Candidatus Thermokryptus mobilis]CUU06751.1 FecR family protein [Candidatus Thermokryptus mobilis]